MMCIFQKVLQKKSRKFDSWLKSGFRKMYGPILSLEVFFRKILPARIRTLQKNVVSAQLVDLYPQQFAADFVGSSCRSRNRRQNTKSPALKATVLGRSLLVGILIKVQTSWGSPWISRATEP